LGVAKNDGTSFDFRDGGFRDGGFGDGGRLELRRGILLARIIPARIGSEAVFGDLEAGLKAFGGDVVVLELNCCRSIVGLSGIPLFKG